MVQDSLDEAIRGVRKYMGRLGYLEGHVVVFL